MTTSNHTLDRIDITFDHTNAVANAGMVLTSTLAGRLGLERLADDAVTVGYRPGRKLATLVDSLLAGGDCINDIGMLHAGATGRVLGHSLVAASTVGTWLRQFTFGHVRQLDHVTGQLLTRAWAGGAGPGGRPMFIDMDSTECEVHGYAKQGAGFGHGRIRCLHPLLATRASTGVYGYPEQQAAEIAVDTVTSADTEVTHVLLCTFDEETAQLYRQALGRRAL